MSKNGRLALILPIEQEEQLLEITNKYGFGVSYLTKVRGTAQSPIKRILVEFSRLAPINRAQKPQVQELIIEHQRHQYTKEYRELVGEFYLKM